MTGGFVSVGMNAAARDYYNIRIFTHIKIVVYKIVNIAFCYAGGYGNGFFFCVGFYFYIYTGLVGFRDYIYIFRKGASRALSVFSDIVSSGKCTRPIGYHVEKLFGYKFHFSVLL